MVAVVTPSYSGDVSFVSLNIMMLGFYPLIIQSRYLCFFSKLMPLTFHMSTVRSTWVVLKFPPGG